MACANVDDDDTSNQFDITQESQRIFLPIDEVDKVPIVSLEAALQPLIELMPQIDRKMRLAKLNCVTPANGLSCDESASIYLCTMRWKPIDECLYFLLNAILHKHDLQKMKPWYLYLTLLLTALDRLPSASFTFYRQMEDDFVRNDLIRNVVVSWNFTFCSLSVALSKSNSFFNQKGRRTLGAFHCCNAKLIEEHSAECKKNEILLIPTQFQSRGYLDRKTDLKIIQLEEINQSSPLIRLITTSRVAPIKRVHWQTPIMISRAISYQNYKLEKHISLHQTLSEVSLAYQNLTAQDMPIIIEQAIVGKQCTKLWLNKNHMTSECIAILVSALPNNKTLKELHINEAGVSDNGVALLARAFALNNCSINVLGLDKNNITNNSIQYLIAMFQTNTTLTDLYLRPNPISRRRLRRLIKGVPHNRRLSIH